MFSWPQIPESMMPRIPLDLLMQIGQEILSGSQSGRPADLPETVNQLQYNVFWTDKESLIVGYNQQVVISHQLPLPAVNLNYRQFAELAGTSQWLYERFESQNKRLMETGEVLINAVDLPIAHRDGRVLYLVSSRFPIKACERGEYIGILGISVDITQYWQSLRGAHFESTQHSLAMGATLHQSSQTLNAILALLKSNELTASTYHQIQKRLAALAKDITHCLEAPDMKRSSMPIDVFTLMGDLDQCFFGRCSDLNVTFSWQVASKMGRSCVLPWDPRIIMQALSIIIENSLLHGHVEWITILVTFRETPTGIIGYIEVQDNGIGLPDKLIDYLNAPGLPPHPTGGLGLALLKVWVSQMPGAELSASQCLDKGTAICLALPMLDISQTTQSEI